MAADHGTETLQAAQPRLVDRYGRAVTYLRLSVTDRCDLRCVYCMAEQMEFLPRGQLLTLEEHARIARAFVALGVRKIRVTGGEPLTRRNIMQLFAALGALEGLAELTLTTNGTQLPQYAQALQAVGVSRVNISLDTLRPERFRAITRVGELDKTLAGIDAALSAGFTGVKLNAVIMRGQNDDEIVPLVEYALARGLDISFIEEMPLGDIDHHDRRLSFVSSHEIRAVLNRHFELVATTDSTGGPSRYHRINGSRSRVGFISPHSHNFCDTCNRVRLTSEGRLLLCLGQEHSVDLRAVVREHPEHDAPLRAAILGAMDIKPKGHEFTVTEKPVLFRHMNVTGG
jgi:cyclic pyranopterin phosphate synthase